MRLILPSFDKDRGPYGFKEHMLAKRLIHQLNLGKESRDAHTLLHYKTPDSKSVAIGDFAATASHVLRYRLSQKCSLTLDEVNERLDNIAHANATKDTGEVDKQLQLLCRKVTEVEIKWLIRILLKQMKVGMQESTVLSVFHIEAVQLYDVCSSLKQVCEELHEPSTRLDVIRVRLGVPFRPMLANRAPLEKISEIMGSRPFFVEIKYDGERVQLHKDGSRYSYFSRNGNDFTKSYGSSAVEEGSLSRHIDCLFAAHVRSCIIDAEMVGWNPEAQCIATKGEQFDVKSLRDGDFLQPCLVVFDCLEFNGAVLSMETLSHRLEVLQSLFLRQKMGRLMLAERKTLSTTQELVTTLNEAIDRREEGLVIKRPDSTYRLNARSNEAGWLKLKKAFKGRNLEIRKKNSLIQPDYVDAVGDDFDLVIVGGYFGEGRRSKLMSHFLLALISAEDGQNCVTLCKVGSGYTMKELYDLNVHLIRNQGLVRVLDDRRKVPDWLKCGSERPDVYIEPANSAVLQVRAAEITVSGSYAVGYTLRFPRVQNVRFDKSWKECMTTAQFDDLRQEFAGKLAQRIEFSASAHGGDVSGEKNARGKRRLALKPTLGAQFQGADLRDMKTTVSVFDGKEVCVFNGTRENPKADLEKHLVRLGAVVVQNPGPKTFCCVAVKKTLKVRNTIDRAICNVAKCDWLIRCAKEERLVDWHPQDLLFADPQTKLAFGEQFDEFGDSYTKLTGSAKRMKELVNHVVPTKRPKIERRKSMAEFADEIAVPLKYGLFRRCCVFVDMYRELAGGRRVLIPDTTLSLVRARLRLFGAELVDELRTDDGKQIATHIVLDSRDTERLAVLKDLNNKMAATGRCHIVHCDWAYQSISQGRLLDEKAFQL